MKKLEIKMVEGEGDSRIFDRLIRATRFNLIGNFYQRGINRFSAIASINDKYIGFWDGILNDCDAPKGLGVELPFLYSRAIFVSNYGGFRGKGHGTEIKRHQLKFAKSLGCKTLYCEVEFRNEFSLNIQKKLGARIRKNNDSYVYRCCFDLDKLDF